MDTITIIVGGALLAMVVWFLLQLSYSILGNLVKGRKFHSNLQQQFSQLRLSKMLGALGINKTDYIYQTKVKDIRQQMKNCTDCTNTVECDEKLATPALDVTDIDFCNNEAELKNIKKSQSN